MKIPEHFPPRRTYTFIFTAVLFVISLIANELGLRNHELSYKFPIWGMSTMVIISLLMSMVWCHPENKHIHKNKVAFPWWNFALLILAMGYAMQNLFSVVSRTEGYDGLYVSIGASFWVLFTSIALITLNPFYYQTELKKAKIAKAKNQKK